MNLQEIFEKINHSHYWGEVSIRCYSGRFMFGKECVSISGDQGVLGDFLSDCIELICNDLVDLGSDKENASYDGGQYSNHKEQQTAINNINANILELINIATQINKYSMDSMGLGVVYYWPNIPWYEK